MTISALLMNSAIGAVGGGGASVTLSSVAALTAAGSSGTFGSCTATVTGGVASAWVWSIINPVGGTFSIASGAGTATATPQVTGVSGASATALLKCVVTTSAGTFTVTTPLSFTNSTVVSVSMETVPAKVGVTGSVVFNACAITVTGGTASSYVWDIISQVNGTFSENGGAGTSVFGSQVSGVAASTTATATLRCVTTVGGTPYTTTTPLSYQNTSGSSSFTINVTPSTQSASSSTSTATTPDFFVANLSGGTAPYSYAFSCVSNDAGLPNTNFTGLTPTASSTKARAVGIDASYGAITAVFNYVASDSAGHSDTGTCTASFYTTYDP